MAFNLQGGYGAGAGADMLQQILKQKALEYAQAEQIRVADERTKQEAARIAQEGERLKGDAEQRRMLNESLMNDRTFKQNEQTQKDAAASAKTQQDATLGTLRGAMTASQNLSGTADPTGAAATRGALRVAMASGGAEPKDIPQEPPAAKPTTQPVMRISRTGQMENIGEAPAGAHFVQEPAPPSQGLAGAPSALNPEGVDYAATQYRVTGTMPAMGMGNGPARAAIINKAAEQARVLGQTPAIAIQKQAAYSGDKTALAKMKTMQAAAGAYENKALAQADLIDGLSAKVPRTSIPLINRAIIAGQTQIAGDPAASQYANAIQTFAAEYAKIMEGSTGSVAASTDTSRKITERLVNASQNPQQLKAVVELMRKEMRLTIEGYDATVDHITQRMGGASPTTAPGGSETPEARLKRLMGGG